MDVNAYIIDYSFSCWLPMLFLCLCDDKEVIVEGFTKLEAVDRSDSSPTYDMRIQGWMDALPSHPPSLGRFI